MKYHRLAYLVIGVIGFAASVMMLDAPPTQNYHCCEAPYGSCGVRPASVPCPQGTTEVPCPCEDGDG